MIITLSGKAESGKDLAGKLLKEELEKDGKKVLIIHYADYLKYICKQYFGWDGVKDDNGRTILQKVGTDIVRTRKPDFWVNIVLEFLDVFYQDYDFVLIPDCRFPNEIVAMKEKFDTSSVWVVRLGHENALSEEQRNHPSETSLDTWDFDYVVRSVSGEENLRQQVIKLKNKIG